MKLKVWYVTAACMVLSFACGVDTENRPSPQDRWPGSGDQRDVSEPVPIAERTSSRQYGLPKVNQCQSDSDCIDGRKCVFPELEPETQPSIDGEMVDAGMVDVGMMDAGMMDAGMVDVGMVDVGMMDAGMMDAGVDTGMVDAGREPESQASPNSEFDSESEVGNDSDPDERVGLCQYGGCTAPCREGTICGRDGECIPYKRSIADLIDLFPSEYVRFGPNYFPWGRQPLECLNDRTIPQAGESFVFEGVVTIPGTYYVKASICDQEERFYGSFVVEDDTGGILVLRDSRVAQVQPGDVVEITVHSAVFVSVYSYVESRAIYSYDMVIKPQKKSVLFETLTTPFDETHTGETKRVTGYPLELPSNLNFSTMVLTDQEFPRADFEATLNLATAACADKSSAAACSYAEVVCTPDGACSERLNENGEIQLQDGTCETRESDATLVCNRPLSSTYGDCLRRQCPIPCGKANCQGSDGGNRCRQNKAIGTPSESYSKTVCVDLRDGEVCEMPSGVCKEADITSPTVDQCQTDLDCIAGRKCVVAEPNSGFGNRCKYVCPEICGEGTSCGPNGECVPEDCPAQNECEREQKVCTSDRLCVESSIACNVSADCAGFQVCKTTLFKESEPGGTDGDKEALSYTGRCRFIEGQTQLSCVSEETCDNCAKYVCPELCKNYNPENDGPIDGYLTENMPICWEAGLNQELVRRGYELNGAQRIEITGPVLRGFGEYSRKIAAERLGQVEVLWSEEYE